ncbi:MAG TPA: hypothetical protein VFQ53_11870 [Kofleriaceae bacterium]|nr:hypothetical protein [Kofleriaceae bacterium]
MQRELMTVKPRYGAHDVGEHASDSPSVASRVSMDRDHSERSIEKRHRCGLTTSAIDRDRRPAHAFARRV